MGFFFFFLESETIFLESEKKNLFSFSNCCTCMYVLLIPAVSMALADAQSLHQAQRETLPLPNPHVGRGGERAGAGA